MTGGCGEQRPTRSGIKTRFALRTRCRHASTTAAAVLRHHQPATCSGGQWSCPQGTLERSDVCSASGLRRPSAAHARPPVGAAPIAATPRDRHASMTAAGVSAPTPSSPPRAAADNGLAHGDPRAIGVRLPRAPANRRLLMRGHRFELPVRTPPLRAIWSYNGRGVAARFPALAGAVEVGRRSGRLPRQPVRALTRRFRRVDRRWPSAADQRGVRGAVPRGAAARIQRAEGRPPGRERNAAPVSARLRRRDGARADVLVRPPRSRGRSRHRGEARRGIGDDLPAVQRGRRDRIRGRHLQGRNRDHARARSTPGAERQPGAHRTGAHRATSERQPRARGLQLLGGARSSRAAAEHEHLRRDFAPGARAQTGSQWAGSPGANQGKRAADGEAHRSFAVSGKRRVGAAWRPGPSISPGWRARRRPPSPPESSTARSRWSSPAVWK